HAAHRHWPRRSHTGGSYSAAQAEKFASAWAQGARARRIRRSIAASQADLGRHVDVAAAPLEVRPTQHGSGKSTVLAPPHLALTGRRLVLSMSHTLVSPPGAPLGTDARPTSVEDRLRQQTARIVVVGLGNAGLPMAVELARAGFQ